VVGTDAAIQAAMRADDLPAQATLTARSYELATSLRLTIYGVRRHGGERAHGLPMRRSGVCALKQHRGDDGEQPGKGDNRHDRQRLFPAVHALKFLADAAL
jgi:hypothetical protein